MKKRMLLTALVADFIAGGALAGELRVSSDGMSPREAQMKIRAARAAGDAAAWTVRVAPGFYALKEPLVFTPADSGTAAAPVTWIGEGRVVLSGGDRISGWSDDGNGVWSAPIPKDGGGKPVFFESLYVNGRRAERARLPKSGTFHAATWSETAVTENGKTSFLEKTTVHEKGLETLAGLSRAELDAAQWRVFVKWAYAAYPVESYDAKTGMVVVRGREKIVSWKNWNGDAANYFILENVAAGFTEPGQWFYDAKGGRVRYRPRPNESLARLEAVAPTGRLISLVEFRGNLDKGDFVRGIRFVNLGFTATRTDGELCENGAVRQYLGQAARNTGATICGNGLKDVRFEKCRVFNTENYAFRFENGVVSNAIVSCEIEDAGAGGIWLGNGVSNPLKIANPKYRDLKDPWDHPFPTEKIVDESAAAVRFNLVDDNLIRHCGRVNPEGCGIVLTHAADTKVTHNDISDLYYTGISVGWTWGYYGSHAQRNEIAYNRIVNIGQHRMADMGGIYTLGASFGTTIHHNYIADVDSISYGGWAMYNDEGSEGIRWYCNFCIDTSTESYHMHFGRACVVENCVMINGKQSSLAISRSENHQQVHFKNNIIYRDNGPFVLRGCAMQRGWTRTTWEGNVFWSADGAADLNGPVSGLVANPQFTDPKNGDWTLRPDSPALKLGFKPWDYRLAGRRQIQDPPTKF